MNIHHFEMLMQKLQEHRNEDGSTGFSMEKVYFYISIKINFFLKKKKKKKNKFKF